MDGSSPALRHWPSPTSELRCPVLAAAWQPHGSRAGVRGGRAAVHLCKLLREGSRFQRTDPRSGMSATTKEASRRSVARRLDRAGQRVNEIMARLRVAGDEVKRRMGRRVDSIRAHEAEFRTRLRQLCEANRTAGIAELYRALEQLETEIDIAQAQLNAELATDEAAFAAAVAAELEAWDSQMDTLAARVATSKQGTRQHVETAIELVRERRADAGRKLAQFMAAGSEASEAVKAGIRQAINDLEWATEEAASEFGNPRRSQ